MRDEINRLKRRRDALLNRACTRQERPKIMAEVRALNRQIQALEARRRPK